MTTAPTDPQTVVRLQKLEAENAALQKETAALRLQRMEDETCRRNDPG